MMARRLAFRVVVLALVGLACSVNLAAEKAKPEGQDFSPAAIEKASVLAADPDSDGDGLSDFQEVHKYRTDPKKEDSDGDGVPDADWHERREFTYSVRSVVKVMRPCHTDVLNDDYQDARVLAENERYVELEVIHYPLNSIADSIHGQRDWRDGTLSVRRYLEPGTTTNWDEELKADLLEALTSGGIDVEALTDAEAVRQVSNWLLARAEYRYMFGTYFVHFPNGKAGILPGLEDAFQREKGNTDLPLEEHFQHELYGKGMFYNKSRGTCTSTAIYLTTGLRAVGIPCRMVIVIPIVDPNDEKQIELIERGISHHGMRQHLLGSLRSQRGFIAHTLNEVFVGGRWHRLNNSQLGANIDAVFGLATHVSSFHDLSEAELTKTWGWRYGKGERDDTFRTSNPYRATELSDRFGIHCTLGNPEVEIKEHKQITISKAYWHDSDDAPEIVKASEHIRPDGAGHLFIHGDEWFRGEPYTQYKDFMRRADPDFRLVAEGQEEIKGSLSSLYITHESRAIREIEIRIPPEEYAKMARGVSYRLVPVNSKDEYQWKVEESVRIRKR